MEKYIYISGPITDCEGYMEKFKECSDYIKRNTDCHVLNPAVIVPKILERDGIKNPSYNDYKRASILLLTLKRNTSIVFLPGYENSTGCSVEENVSSQLGYEKFFFNPEIPCILKFDWSV